jgi:hypothetical protein
MKLKQIINEEIENLVKSKRAIRQIIDSETAYAILDSTTANGSTWCAGGCAILAHALNIAYGYPVFVIYNSTDGQVEHFGVKTPDNTFIDCDGEQRDWLRNFRRKDFYLHPEKKLVVLPYSKDLNITDIVIDMNASKQLAGLIKPDLNEEVLNEKTYKVYHGTNEKFGNFDFKRATDGIVWFTDSIESIKSGEHGGMGNKYIMTRFITLNNPAGWDEYEKYGLGQLQSMGYDGIILPQGTEYNDYIVFSPKSIRAKQSDINEGDENNIPDIIYHGGDCNNLKSLYNNFVISTPEEKMGFPSTGGGNFGLSATIDKTIAKKYSSIMGCNAVLSIRVNPSAKIIFIDTEGNGIDHYYTTENMEELVVHKYDAIMETDDGAEKEIRILRPDNFKVIGIE